MTAKQRLIEATRRIRWEATIYYKSETGTSIDVTHTFCEMSDFNDIVERGANFYAIENIIIRHIHDDKDSLTYEESLRN